MREMDNSTKIIHVTKSLSPYNMYAVVSLQNGSQELWLFCLWNKKIYIVPKSLNVRSAVLRWRFCRVKRNLMLNLGRSNEETAEVLLMDCYKNVEDVKFVSLNGLQCGRHVNSFLGKRIQTRRLRDGSGSNGSWVKRPSIILSDPSLSLQSSFGHLTQPDAL